MALLVVETPSPLVVLRHLSLANEEGAKNEECSVSTFFGGVGLMQPNLQLAE